MLRQLPKTFFELLSGVRYPDALLKGLNFLII